MAEVDLVGVGAHHAQRAEAAEMELGRELGVGGGGQSAATNQGSDERGELGFH